MAAVASTMVLDFATMSAKWGQSVWMYNPVSDDVESLPLCKVLSSVSTSGECLIKLLKERAGVYNSESPILDAALEEASSFAEKIRTFQSLARRVSEVCALFQEMQEQVSGLPGLADLIWLKERVEEKAQPAIESAHHEIQQLRERVELLESASKALKELLPKLDEAWVVYSSQFTPTEGGLLSYFSWSKEAPPGALLLKGIREIGEIQQSITVLQRKLVTAKHESELGAYLSLLSQRFAQLALRLNPKT